MHNDTSSDEYVIEIATTVLTQIPGLKKIAPHVTTNGSINDK